MDLVFPRKCPLCSEIVIPKDKKACTSCIEKLPFITEPRCKRCSKPVTVQEQEYCYDCIKARHHYESGFAVFLYQGNIKKSLMDYKFRGLKQYVDFYVEQLIIHLGEKLNHLHFDFMIPVPLHNRKLRMRGFNQSELIAQGLSEYLQIPVRNDILLRTRFTTPQKTLDPKERLQNMIEAFDIRNSREVNNKKILIVDDIYTTGSTIDACSAILLKAGCAKVYFVTVCIGDGI